MIALFLAMLACEADPETQDSVEDTGTEDSGRDDTGDSGDTGETGDTGTVDKVTVTEDGGVRSFLVDGTSESDWIYIDLSAGEVPESAPWDVRVQRFNLEASDALGVAWQPDEAFEDLDAPLAGLPWDSALESWYAYDPNTHVLSPWPGSYALETPNGPMLLEVVDYYHPDTGASGHLQFKVKAVDAAPSAKVTHITDAGIRTTQVDARDGTVTLRLASGAPASAGHPTLWDLSFDRYTVLGEGVQVEVLAGEDFEGLTSVSDEAAFEGVLSDWYDYDPTTHSLSPKDQVYVLRTSTLDYKLQFLDYYEGGESGFVSFRWAPLGLGL